MIPVQPEGRPMSAAEAELRGWTVDRHCYPWFAYKGPRFDPTHSMVIVTPEHGGNVFERAQGPVRIKCETSACPGPGVIRGDDADALKERAEHLGWTFTHGARCPHCTDVIAGRRRAR